MFQRLHIQEGSSLICNTSDRHERHECDTNATRVLHERLECDMSAAKTTRVRHERKILVLIATRVKTYFYTPIFTIWLMKDYKKRNSFILRTTFLHVLYSCRNAFKKCTTKSRLFNYKSYIKKLYTRL